jgi:hypothetical protein
MAAVATVCGGCLGAGMGVGGGVNGIAVSARRWLMGGL